MDNCLIDRFDLIRPGKLHLPSRTGVSMDKDGARRCGLLHMMVGIIFIYIV